MKQISKAVALAVVTTLFATAFTTHHLDQHMSAPSATEPVAQVVIVGKRMNAAEKNQFDAQLQAQLAAQSSGIDSREMNHSVK